MDEAAGLHYAEAAAAIEVGNVSIITLLTGLENVVTTAGRLAIVGTGIGADQVSIITLFTRIFHAITTRGDHAVATTVVGEKIRIQQAHVALFTAVTHSVAAHRKQGRLQRNGRGLGGRDLVDRQNDLRGRSWGGGCRYRRGGD